MLPDFSIILTASFDKTVKFWNKEGTLIYELPHEDHVHKAMFSSDGNRILTASADGKVKLWKLKAESRSTKKKLKGLDSLVSSSCGVVESSDIKTELIWDRKIHNNIAYEATFSPDEQFIITASADKTAKLLDKQGREIRVFEGHKDTVFSAFFSPDGTRIVTASADKTVKIWEFGGRLLNMFKSHEDRILSAMFSPDGNRILTASDDKTAKLLDLAGNVLVDFKDYNPLNFASFSPDGNQIVTASSTVRLWDIKGNLIANLDKHKRSVNGVFFSSDGKGIFSTSADGTVKIWYTPEAIMEWLKTAPIPKLSKEDKEELGIADFEID